MLPANASPNARMMPDICGLDTITATSATVTMLPSKLKNWSPTAFVPSVSVVPFYVPIKAGVRPLGLILRGRCHTLDFCERFRNLSYQPASEPSPSADYSGSQRQHIYGHPQPRVVGRHVSAFTRQRCDARTSRESTGEPTSRTPHPPAGKRSRVRMGVAFADPFRSANAHTSAENVNATESHPDQDEETERGNHDDCRPPFGGPGTGARQNVSSLGLAVVHESSPDHRNTFWAIATSL